LSADEFQIPHLHKAFFVGRHLMWKFIITILFGQTFISNSFGQVQNETKKVLQTKNFVAFKKYCDDLGNKKSNVSSHWESLRELTNNFQEGVFVFSKSIPHKDEPQISSVYNFRVRLIATDKVIAYYELSEQKNKKVNDDWEPYYEIIDTFRNKTLTDSLHSSFKKIYKTNLNEKELFIIDFVFGENCGFAGVNPSGQEQIDEWVESKNKKELLKWLKSTNTERQVYAIKGLLQLKTKGIKLTVEEVNLIKFIKNKKGTIYVCSGCIPSRNEISIVTKDFKL